MDENQKALYRKLEQMIAPPEKEEAIRAGVEFSPEAYIHTNEDYATDQMWAYSFTERKPFATISLSAYLDSFYT